MNLSRNASKRPNDGVTIQEEIFPAAEKILSDIENVIKKDLELKSFEIIPIQDNENKSPVYHEEHSLGLASWCVQPLYCYAYGRLIDLKRSEYRRAETSTISRWLMGALLLNPDVSTFWNIRRELVRTGRLEGLRELQFTALVLYHKAKCFEAFAYRRWLLQHLLTGGKTSSEETRDLLSNEIQLAEISADRYANNYHAWSHREYVMTYTQKKMPEFYASLLKSEWISSGEWCSRHVSDHSGLAYRQFLLKRLLYEKTSPGTSSCDELEQRRELVERFITPHLTNEEIVSLNARDNEAWRFLNYLHSSKVVPRRSELDYDQVLVALSYWVEDCKNNENNILTYPGHEALWYHRRFLGHALICLENSYARNSPYEYFTIHQPIRESSSEVSDTQSDDEDTLRTGLLALAFRQDNERIIKIAKNSKNSVQVNFGEKFLKYIAEFSSDSMKLKES
ncbi:protein prenyltransferase alpha subunit repeat-containing protein 1 [Venturia canescens]|uniref:protein prenyltransferase alpha subunit repeat-containing protein 1 n=1 Tax=Venturia canescens TaxID=32260 RepID=UPI001C9C4D57|nr:protein prenyltransferase alpha subunit repeat-containing protein 1 [Venturia canescens]